MEPVICAVDSPNLAIECFEFFDVMTNGWPATNNRKARSLGPPKRGKAERFRVSTAPLQIHDGPGRNRLDVQPHADAMRPFSISSEMIDLTRDAMTLALTVTSSVTNAN